MNNFLIYFVLIAFCFIIAFSNEELEEEIKGKLFENINDYLDSNTNSHCYADNSCKIKLTNVKL